MTNIRELDWQSYEGITKYIYETLGRSSGVKILGHGSSCKVRGKSGIHHQIDVLTSHSFALKSYRTAIECKFWKKKVDKEVVMKIYGVIEDAGIEKGVIVSKGGFTKDALAFAKHKNIGLVELKEPTRNSCNESQSTINIGSLEIRSQVTCIPPEILGTALEYIDKTTEANDINFYSTSIKLSDGGEVPLTYYTNDFQRELHDKNRLWQTITKRYEMEAPCLIRLNQKSAAQIKALTFTGMLTKHDLNSNLKLSLVDQVWLTMKVLFEEQGFAISESGLIIATES